MARRFTDAVENRIAKHYQQGFSLQQLAERFKCNNRTVKNALIRQNVQVRRMGAPSKGGKLHLAGYIYIRPDSDDPFHCMVNSSGYVAQHRYVLAKHLNRALEKHETVHHIDGDRKNNAISNLQLRSSSHGPGVVHVCLNCGSQNIKALHI
jgi:nicotinic acid phosphoribosyltransferase